MDPDSPVSRAERTFWTVWNYITGAVNRFFRPEPISTVNDDQPSAVHSEPVDSGHSESDPDGQGVSEHPPVSTASLLSSSRPVVVWDLCTTEIEESTQLSEGTESKVPKEGEGKTEEEIGQTRNDDAGQLVFKTARDQKDKEEENRGGKLDTYGQSQTSENDEDEEDEKTGSQNLTEHGMNEDLEVGRMASAGEESQRTMTLEDRQMGKIQVTGEIFHVGEQHLKAEDAEIAICLMTDRNPLHEHNVHIEEVQQKMAETEVEHGDAVSLLVSENENGNHEMEEQFENQCLVCEELSEEDTYDRADSGISSPNRELKMTIRQSSNVSDVESDEVKEEEKVSGTMRKIHEKEEMLSVEQVLEEAEDGEIKLCLMSDLSPVEVQTAVSDTEVEDIDVVSPLVSENEHSNDEVEKQTENQCLVCEELSEEGIYGKADSGLSFLQSELKTTIRKCVSVSEDVGHKNFMADRSESDEVEDHEVQTKTRETDTVIDNQYVRDISVEGRIFVKDEEEEEDGILSSEEEDNNTSCVDTACGIPSGTMKSERETGKEICKQFKSTPSGIYEGQELNSTTCAETQEGVPEYNNKPGPDEHITQWFLEEGDYKEFHATQLPEEVESGEPESLQNSGSGGDFSLVREHKEDEQGSTADEPTRTHKNTGKIGLLETERQIVKPVEGPGYFSEEEEVRLVQNLKTTWTEHSEEAFGTVRIVTELQGRTGELLGDSETDEGVSGMERIAADNGQKSTGSIADIDLPRFTDKTLKLLESKREKMTSEAAFGSDYESSKPPSLEDSAGLGDLKQADTTERKLASGTGMDETGVEAVENETQNKSEMQGLNLDVAPTTLETKKQQSHEVFEILTDMGDADDFLSTRNKPKVLTDGKESHAGRTSSTIRCQDFIDEEILDLWIEAASFQDTNVADEQETGQKMHVNVATLQTEEKEKLLELISGKSVNDTETYLSTTESGLLDLSVIEQERDVRETSSEAFQSLNDKLFTELLTTPNYESQEATERGQSDMTEEESISVTGFHNDSGLQLSEAGYQSQEKMDQEGDIRSSMQTEKGKEKFEEWISGESGLLDHHTSARSFPGPNDMLAAEISTQELNFDSQEAIEKGQSAMTENESIAEMGFHPDCKIRAPEAGLQESDHSQQRQGEEGDESSESETGSQKGLGADNTDLTIRTDEEKTHGEDALLEVTVLDSSDEINQSRSGSDSSFQEETMLTESQNDTCTEGEEKLIFSSLNKPQADTWSDDTYDSIPKLRPEIAEEPATHSDLPIEMNVTVLDFTAQKSRIAVKNPNVRPPQNPRSLLHMPSEHPTPTTHLQVKAHMGVTFGGMGMGIKLPGLGAGFPVLKKTCVVAEDKSSEESETKPDEKSDSPKPHEAQHRPKWMPPTHQGFGNPFMSELKTKLRKTTEE